MLSFFFFFEVKAQQYFVSSRNMFLEKKTVLKIGLILGGHLSRNRDLGCMWVKIIPVFFVCLFGFVLFFNFINTLCLSTASNGLSLDLGKVHY